MWVLGFFNSTHDLILRPVYPAHCLHKLLEFRWCEICLARMDPHVRYATGNTVMGRNWLVVAAPGTLASEATMPTVL